MPGYNLLNARLHIKQLRDRPDGQDVIENVAEEVAEREDTPVSAIPDVIAYCIHQYADGQRLESLTRTHHVEYDVLGQAIEEISAKATERTGGSCEEDDEAS
ncbi:hypothetical protein [Halobacterium rubrum]|uniref:hypothetical protein n=1 Tax=Halobacterium TaxID=2239 RepID=UPI001F21EF8A|nr:MULTISPECIES: hypothetical protein [Halobacterium]MDH5021696.1 hypothetical protein [Halobacterium rubrum]